MKRNIKAGLSVALALLVLSPVLSCKKEEPGASSEGQSYQALNSYSENSVFMQVKDKLKQNPGDADEWYHLADLYDRSGQYPDAIEAYKKVVQLKPRMGYAYFKMGTAYDRMNRPADAVASLEKSIKYLPTNVVAYNNLGIAYGKLGKVKDEIRVLKKAIKLRSSYSAARYNLGVAYLKAGDRNAAQRQYDSLKDMDRGMAEALLKVIKEGVKS